MRVLALDLSTHTGFAVFEGEVGKLPTLIESGTIDLGKGVLEFGPYPHCYKMAGEGMATAIETRIPGGNYDAVVIEQINSGRDRYVQKLLENIHTAVCSAFRFQSVVYLDSDGANGWRTHLGLKLSKEEKKANAKLSKAKREAEENGTKLDKKKLGIAGKKTKKHLALDWVRTHYKPQLKVKDNNESDAICVGAAFFMGATPCDGT